jgi:hypothetical protein
MGGIAREMVLDMVLRFWCRNDSGRIKSQVLHLATWQGNVPFCEYESCDRFSRIFLRKETKDLLEKMEDVSGSFFKCENSS